MSLQAFFATEATQGQRANDFCLARTDPPELLVRGLVCGRDIEIGPDGSCGCNRILNGTETHQGTTTLAVGVYIGSEEDLAAEFAAGHVDGAWAKTVEEALPAARGEAAWVTAEAARFQLGTILEYRAGVLAPRTPVASRTDMIPERLVGAVVSITLDPAVYVIALADVRVPVEVVDGVLLALDAEWAVVDLASVVPVDPTAWDAGGLRLALPQILVVARANVRAVACVAPTGVAPTVPSGT